MLRPLRPSSAAAEASHSAPAPSTSTGRLSLSYHSLRSLILALAQWAADVCDGDKVLLGSNRFIFYAKWDFLCVSFFLWRTLQLQRHESCNVLG
jgi:hypothetical protein